MRYIECPEEWDGQGISLFMGGGITGCHNWQQEMVRLLSSTNLVLLNPRRNFYEDSLKSAKFQISWEYRHLKTASARMFWFPSETLCPITLFELGKWCEKSDPLFVGCHPDYKRKIDLEIQLDLCNPNIVIQYSLEEIAEYIKCLEL